MSSIHAESGGWPHFAQLIAETAVTLANESPSGGRTQPVPYDAAVRRSLNRRQLCVEAGSGEWRLRVPLMGRWLRKEW